MTVRIYRSFLLGLLLSLSWAAYSAEGLDHHEITIWSGGARLQGDIFKPAELADDAPVPGILLVHGWGGTKSHLNMAYAPQLARLGFVVLTFDFRSWGESEGFLLTREPMKPVEDRTSVTVEADHIRLLVDPLRMLEDARAALAYLAGEPGVQTDNIGIWGTSLGGGLALVTAANDSRIKALVSQIGAVDNRANFAGIAAEQAQMWESQRARGEIPPFPGPESKTGELKGYADYVALMRYDPAAYWDRLQIPTLVIDAKDEELFDRMKNGAALQKSLRARGITSEYKVFPGKHYDIYRDAGYQKALKAAQDWFLTHLGGS